MVFVRVNQLPIHEVIDYAAKLCHDDTQIV